MKRAARALFWLLWCACQTSGAGARTESKPPPSLSTLERLHQENPAQFDVAHQLAEAHARQGTLVSFRQTLEKTLPSQRATTHYMLGLAYFTGPGASTAKSLEHLAQATTLAPDEGEPWLRLGLVRLETGAVSAAVPILRRATQRLPKSATAHLVLAKALLSSGEHENGVAALKQVLECQPSPAQVQSGRSLQETFDPSSLQVPEAAKGRIDKAVHWLQEIDVPQEAITVLEDILREFPSVALAHSLLGLAYQRIDDSGRAIDEFKRAIELSPFDGKNHYYLGELYLSKQRSDLARAAFNRAIEVTPFLEGPYFRLGDLALDRGELDLARQLFERLTRLSPEAIPPRGKLALVYQRQQEWAAADRELRHVVSRHPDNAEFVLRLGILHTERFQSARNAAEREAASYEAQKWLRDLLKRQPDNALAQRALDQVQGRLP